MTDSQAQAITTGYLLSMAVGYALDGRVVLAIGAGVLVMLNVISMRGTR